jgi:hypothetical protein
VSKLRVIIGCEHSGVVRRAFRAAGHDAWSCDILPAEDGDPHHHQMDILTLLLLEPFDLGIFHPPCTRLCLSGVRWLHERNLWAEMRAAAAFFKALLHCGLPRVAVENPVMHRYAKEIIGEGPTQFIQPWEHGHPEKRKTGLWLRNLPPLQPTNIVEGRHARVHRARPGPTRWMERSRTLEGHATAMVQQWGRA